jgi:uncharacterized protein
MSTRSTDWRRLHVEALARDHAALEGSEPVTSFPRLMTSAHPDASPETARAVHWRACGELRQPHSIEPQNWLHLEARTSMPLVCQRCLGPVATPLDVDRWFRFVRDEDEAAALDAQIEDDVLALGRPLDLLGLIEDELLLALPLVPRHERCPVPLPMSAGIEPELEAEPANPFAALEALKRRGNGGA